MKKEEMEKYSLWYKIDNAIAGLYHKISLIYLVLFIIMTGLLILRTDIFKPYMSYYYFGIFLFIISIYIFFTGSLLKGIN